MGKAKRERLSAYRSPRATLQVKYNKQIFRLQLQDSDWLQRKPALQTVHFFPCQRHLLLRKGKEGKEKNESYNLFTPDCKQK